jgi:hypothetical protein
MRCYRISGCHMCGIGKLHLIAPNATKCKFVSLITDDFDIFLPKCSKVDYIDKTWRRSYDPDIF